MQIMCAIHKTKFVWHMIRTNMAGPEPQINPGAGV